ncbi:MAG TPA: hypothetical protein VI911_11105 [Patescibacteria group bacterium]|nr:hypothetical protein [Patescibacteria group bacterium]
MKNIPLGEWKAKYGRIFKVRIEEKEIYFRLLNAGEIEICKKTPKTISKLIDSVILNNESLSSTGSKYKLSDFIIRNSFPSTDDQLKEKILHHRYKVKDDFTLNLIAKLCSVYVSYTPDDLKSKTIDQLLELVAIAEVMTGKQLLNDKKGKKPGVMNTRRDTQERDESKFAKPPVNELMEETTNALQAAMTKFGKKVPILSEIKAKTSKPLTDLQRQMKELNKAI